VGRFASDIGIYFIEDEHRHLVLRGQHGFQRQHDPRKLSGGGNGSQWPRRFARIRGELELDSIQARRTRLVEVGGALQFHFQPALGETEAREFLRDGARQLRHYFLASGR